MLKVAFGSLIIRRLSFLRNCVSRTGHFYPTETRPLSSHVLENKENRAHASRSWMGMYGK